MNKGPRSSRDTVFTQNKPPLTEVDSVFPLPSLFLIARAPTKFVLLEVRTLPFSLLFLFLFFASPFSTSRGNERKRKRNRGVNRRGFLIPNILTPRSFMTRIFFLYFLFLLYASEICKNVNTYSIRYCYYPVKG